MFLLLSFLQSIETAQLYVASFQSSADPPQAHDRNWCNWGAGMGESDICHHFCGVYCGREGRFPKALANFLLVKIYGKSAVDAEYGVIEQTPPRLLAELEQARASRPRPLR
jgi:hypothetical protein